MIVSERVRIELIGETAAHIDIRFDQMMFCDASGRLFIEKDYKVGGEIWRVHKGDADPFPSRPHAHCVESNRNAGLKLHLGTRELFRRAEPQGRYLDIGLFGRLIELIQPKFPEIKLPLE